MDEEINDIQHAPEEEQGKQATASKGNVKKLKEQIERLQAELDAEKDAKLRAIADSRNIKERARKEREEMLSYSQSALLLKILDLIDDFNNIISSYPVPEKGTAEDSWFNGVLMVYSKFRNLIEEEGVEIVLVKEADVFDPSLHEAVGFVTVNTNEESQKIAKVISNGYKRKGSDKVIKTAKVIVNKIDA